MENDYTNGTTKISRYVQVSMYETLNVIDAYYNSKHVTGDLDAQGREKPFFNIVLAAVNIWFRATDIDRKNIKVKATKSKQDIAAFLATVRLQSWMRKENFGKFLNRWGRALAKYGSAVSKFVEQNGKLVPSVVPWNRIICDTIDFDSNPVIEKLEMTRAQLRKRKEYDQEIVEKLIEAAAKARTELDKTEVDNKNDYITIYEVHGELALSFLTGKEEDQDKYRQQMQVVSYVAGKGEGEFDDFVLFKGKEKQSPYQKDDLIEEDDQTLSMGAVQNLFESQWMVNHSIKSIKDQLDLASKIIFQTSDSNFVGQNALAAIQQGDILIHAPNMPLTQVGNNSSEVTQQQNFLSIWRGLGNEINGITDAMRGNNQPAGSAWRQTEALIQQSESLFEIMTENKGLSIEQMLRKFIIPFVKKGFDTTEEVTAILDSYNLSKIDAMYIPNQAIRRGNQAMIEEVLKGNISPQADYNAHAKNIQSELNQSGNQRFFKPSEVPTKTWKELFKDLEWELEVDITGEQKDTQAVMQTLDTALKFVTTATPEQLADPNFKLVFNKILEESAVISPIEIASIPPAPPKQIQNKVSESMSYKDAPSDVQRQIEAQAGLKPSQSGIQPVKKTAAKQPVLTQ